MQKILLVLFLSMSGISAFSQQDYFLYMQSDEHQPFYARISNRIYSSSESGYLIIPKLGDSSYQVTIGFAKNIYPEQYFTVAINKSDKGFQLKKSGERGWNLINLQNMSALSSTGSSAVVNEDIAGVKKTDPLSQMLANVVNDSSILFAAVNKTEQAKPKKTEAAPAKENETVAASQPPVAPVQQPVRSDSVMSTAPVTAVSDHKTTDNKTETSTASGSAPVPPVETKPIVKVETNPPRASGEEVEKPFITRIAEEKTAYQYTATYLEQYNVRTDTVRISIMLKDKPEDATPVASSERPTPLPEEQKPITKTVVPTEPVPVIDSATTSTKRSTLVVLNSDCKNIASEHDVDKLRIRLLSDNAVDDKLATAKKFYRNRCFTVKQIRALAELFPTDETKYRYFETSYPFISDTVNIHLLEDLIQGDFYKSRFRTMINK